MHLAVQAFRVIFSPEGFKYEDHAIHKGKNAGNPGNDREERTYAIQAEYACFGYIEHCRKEHFLTEKAVERR
ncbi:hypothetical protein D3C73_1310310 [compost metagenome]